MTFEIRREFIDKFTDSKRYVFARIQISFSKVQFRRRRRKNFQSQTKFNVNSHDERECHSENVLIEKSTLLNELSDKQMTISRKLKHVIE